MKVTTLGTVLAATSSAVALAIGVATGCSDPGIEGGTAGGTGGTAGSGTGATQGTGGAGGPGQGSGGSFGGPAWADASAPRGAGGAGVDPDKPICRFEKVGLERQPPELLLVLDRSGSMGGTVSGATKWTAVVGAMDQVVKATQGGVHWGINLFPWPVSPECSTPARPLVEPAPNNHPPISSLLGTQTPGGGGAGSPGQTAIKNAAGYLKTRTTPWKKYIVYASDGIPNCKGGMTGTGRDEAGTIMAIGDAAAAGFPTFVVGVAADPADAMVLNQLAVAGRQPRPDPVTRYYAASNQQELVTALATIAGIVASCTFTLQAPPPAPNDVAVDVGGRFIPRDPASTDGWNYSSADQRSITLYGSYCDRLKAGEYKTIQFVLGCPGVPPIP